MRDEFGEPVMTSQTTKKRFRSQEWFDNPHNPGMTALYMAVSYTHLTLPTNREV